MALQTIPGSQGYLLKRVSSFDNKAIGKLTDWNHLSSFHPSEAADYDKRIIKLYSQTSLYSNDFLELFNQTTPYFIPNGEDTFKWQIGIPYKHPQIIEVPADTLNAAKPGIDGQEFQFVTDKKDFYIHQIVTTHLMHGQSYYIERDPVPWNSGWLYTCTLQTTTPKTDFVDKNLLRVGLTLHNVDQSVGEFDDELPGLPGMGDRLWMFDSIGSGVGYEHTVTAWADSKILRDAQGRPLDLLVYAERRTNELPITKNVIRWEPFIEMEIRRQMLDLKVNKLMFGRPGTQKTYGSKQEIKKTSAGIYYSLLRNGNYIPFNQGEFSIQLIRSVFGDLFYRRVAMGQRRVKMYTNERGFDIWSQALKEDMFNSGLTVVADTRFIEGTGRKMTVNYEFSSLITRETGRVDIVHLMALDLPQTAIEFGQNKKSPAVFFVFDVSPEGDGTPKGNIREVRMEGFPSMTWMYQDGRRHHLGHAASKGHSGSSSFPGYKMMFDDRYDYFIEDMTRMVLLEEIPYL